VKKKILLVFGTRPEAIKMAPVALALSAKPREFAVRVAVTAQHRGMLDQVLRFFGLRAHHDLDLMRPGQSLTDVTTRVLRGLEPILKSERPHVVLVHGDTTTTLAAALAAFYQRIPVGHVEAGLRSLDPDNPFPEEINRRLADGIARWHFAPTPLARRNLIREGVPARGILVTGNTGIDALHWGLNCRGGRGTRLPPSLARVAALPFVLLTAHRRENFGRPLERIFLAVRDVAHAHPSLRFIYPVHPNPRVQEPARRILGGVPGVHLIAPLDYGPMIELLRRCRFVLTDSGGLQEEAPALGKPVLVCRDTTERPEAVVAGVAKLVGTTAATIEAEARRLLDDPAAYAAMATGHNPYGDGRAAARCVTAIEALA
jgi:UDP-N-acetylglucosamine 2-epimerase (non-hydrolysing)